MTSPSAPSPSLPPHRKVRVDLGTRSYDVVIGRGVRKGLGTWLDELGLLGPVAIVTDNTVNDLYAVEIADLATRKDDPFFKTVSVNSGEKTVSVSPGEKSKELKSFDTAFKDYAFIQSCLAKWKIPRSGIVIALGGGVIGDLAGFVAATYLRGINFVQVPTTLLAMVDSSVGGKTGVNLPEGKNLVGAFHQPKLVVADLDTLKTLPAKEFAAGMAEVIKYGAIRDKALFDRVASGVKPEDADLDGIVETCVAIKARIVENDEFETKGERALLNFGHTIGHAIEADGEYKEFLHGEAIALGMRAAAWLSHAYYDLPLEEIFSIENALVANGLSPQLPEKYKDGRSPNSAQIFDYMGRDKKNKDGYFQFVLLDHLGLARSGCAIDELCNDFIQNTIDHLCKPIGTRMDVPDHVKALIKKNS